MGGVGGFFGSQAATPQVPVPVETIPGAQGLGKALLQYFMPLITGQKAQAPYRGYPSVYGTQTPTLNLGNMMTNQPAFPGLFTGAPPSTGSTGSPGISDAGFQEMINSAVRNAMQPTTTTAPPQDRGQGSNA